MGLDSFIKDNARASVSKLLERRQISQKDNPRWLDLLDLQPLGQREIAEFKLLLMFSILIERIQPRSTDAAVRESGTREQ